MSDHGFGLWAGTAVNDTSSVVAAGYTFSDEAGNLAVVVKLTRTLMIVPVTLALAVYTSRKSESIKFPGKMAEAFVLRKYSHGLCSVLSPLPSSTHSSPSRGG